MSEGTYANIKSDGTRRTNQNIERNQTGNDLMRSRSPRAATVCLVLLCFVLLTAVIMLCVYINTNNKNYTQERHQLLKNITKLTEERVELLTSTANLTKERDELLNKNVPKEKDGLSSTNNELIKHEDQSNQEKNELWNFMNDNELDGFIYYQFSFYYISSEWKSWSESRRDCRDRGADLIIINKTEKQEFVKKFLCGHEFWIGLTDSEEEGSWKWVDGSVLISGSWAFGEPNGYLGKDEDCAVQYPSGWYDYPCNNAFRFVCEKNVMT